MQDFELPPSMLEELPILGDLGDLDRSPYSYSSGTSSDSEQDAHSENGDPDADADADADGDPALVSTRRN